MIEIILPLFSYWLVEIIKPAQTLSEWLAKNNVLYKHWQTGIVFNKYYIGDPVYKLPLRLKPFDCAKCFAFWLCGSYHLYLTGNILESVVIGGVGSFVAVIITWIRS